MYKNNFERPPENKPALELHIFYDTDASRIFFDEQINVLKHDSNGASLAGYECSPETLGEIVNLKSLKKSELIELAKELDWYDEDEKLTKDDLIDDLGNIYIKNRFIDVCEIINKYPSEYDVMVTRGYYQGDCCAVLFKKYNKPSEKYIDHLFWDSPVYARLSIDGEDFYLDECLDDSYDYDREKLLEKIKPDLSEYVFEWLSRNLPEHLEYV